MITPEMKKWLEDHCRDGGKYPLLFDKDNLIPQGFSVPNHLEYYVKLPDEPCLRINITTWRGFNSGAVHWYANIHADAPRICSKDENGKVFSHGGYICEEWKQMPREITDMIGGEYCVEVRRLVTQSDFDKDSDRWEGYKIGYSTPSFDTKESAVAVAVQIARLRFPGWKISIDDYV